VATRAFPVVYSRDVERAAGFYAGWLGFEEHTRLPPEGDAGYIGLRRGDSDLAIVDAAWPQDQFGMRMGDEPRFELFVYVDHVDDAVAAMSGEGVPVLKEPEDMPWGERVGWVADPDGNPVGLATPATPAG
jgi:lactoylglutathione lyase